MAVGGKSPADEKKAVSVGRKNCPLADRKKGILSRSGENPMVVGGKILSRSGEILRSNGGDEHCEKGVFIQTSWASNAHHEDLC